MTVTKTWKVKNLFTGEELYIDNEEITENNESVFKENKEEWGEGISYPDYEYYLLNEDE